MCSYFTNFWLVSKEIIFKIVFALSLFLILPISALAATLSFSPSSGSYPVGSTITVGIYTNSNGEAINALSGIVAYSTDLLEVVSVSKNQSIVSLWVQEPSFSNSAGTVNFEGIVLNPGYTGSSGKILTVTFRIKSAGEPTLSFSSGSILANDGEGSEIISSKGQAQFSATPVSLVVPEPVSTGIEEEPVSESELSDVVPRVVSNTHPEDSWSKEVNGIFNFEFSDDVTALRLLVDDDPDGLPVVTYSPPITTREIKDLDEGVSYLHVQYKNAGGWGEILHYKLQIDTVAPDSVAIKEISPNIFLFTAKDATKEVARYEIQIDGGEVVEFIDDGSHVYTAPTQTEGAHTMTVKAFDAAGNFSVTSLGFTTVTTTVAKAVVDDLAKNPPFDNSWLNTGATIITVLSVAIPFIALVLLLVTLLYTAWRMQGGLKRHIDKEVKEAKIIVHKAFAMLRADLELDIETLKKANLKRKLTKEESKILKRLQKNLAEAEFAINKEMSDIEKATDS